MSRCCQHPGQARYLQRNTSLVLILSVTKQSQHNELQAEIQAAGGALRMTIGNIQAILWLEEKPHDATQTADPE
ncbi:hypothetical protein EYR41_010427 [Orbilia oligospora]|uniref:Uncharacterized protein n=1 Tax=Orbilia oligospora TaxID=2813651 RepID=A0A8H2HMF8_ORBOL|nr:hypothetical protein EYR41_010427 [Orbilia oligospora]